MRSATPKQKWGFMKNSIRQEERPIGDCVIGYDDSKEGDAAYITEPMFVDIAKGITRSGDKRFRVMVDIKATPMVVVFYDGELLFHNHEIQSYLLELKDILNDIHTDIIIKALVDARLVTQKHAKGGNLKALENIVSEKFGNPVNSALLTYLMQSVLYDNDVDETGVRELVSQMDPEGIVVLLGSVYEYGLTEETDNEDLAKLLQKNSVEEIEAALHKEIAYRYFFDTLR